MRIALITGITGQDGSYLSELLIEKDYVVWGIVRKITRNLSESYIGELYDSGKLTLRYGDLQDCSFFSDVLREIKTAYPELERLEIYNLGALTHVGLSFKIPEYCVNVNGVGVLKLLEAIRRCDYNDKIRFYQASTSELFGKVVESPQNENTPFYPRSPYGVAKLYAYWITKNYRETYGLYACNGILFNHESSRRDPIFLSRKVTTGIRDILKGKSDQIILGNLNAMRDWGHAKDFVRGIWMIMQCPTPDDFVLSTNVCHSVREFVEKAFMLKGFDVKWKGKGLDEVGYDTKDGRVLVSVSEEFFRPAEVDILKGDNRKAVKVLGWEPKYDFDSLIQDMIYHDCP